MARVYNFSAGPSVLPEEVLTIAASEMLDYKGSGQSVMEMSHRSKVYEEIIHGAEALMREVMGVPENYHVLMLQGGASSQFAMVPLNLMTKTKKADYVKTGEWAKKAIAEAKRFGEVNVVASSEDKIFNYIPTLDPKKFNPTADYFHITTNNTIYGTKYATLPDTGSVPLVGDMSSNILSEPMDVSRFGLIYAGAQKNLGPSGLTVVIVRKDLVAEPQPQTPTMFTYKIHAENESMFNTPPCYGIYIMKLVLEWVKLRGGVAAMGQINRRKAQAFYDYLDNSAMFKATVFGDCRSLMNIPFVTGNEELDKKFCKEAEKAGLVNLKGHRSVGGMRASIYNAMPEAGVKALIDFMKQFELTNKK